MAAGMNGSAKGRASPVTNGPIKKEPDTQGYSHRSAPRRQGFVGWTASMLLRIAVWYTIGTIILRCPKQASQLIDSSPKLCRPYLQVHDFATPYVQPYYQAHVEPHVQKAQPYVDQAQTKFVRPAAAFAHDNYVKYGAPLVERAQNVGKEQWEKTVLPHLDVARGQALRQYHATLGPYVGKADAKVRPYYDSIATSAYDLWELEILPAYKYTSPYILRGYGEVQKFLVGTVVPYTQWVNAVLWTALNRHVFPTVRVLYDENVEPQIARIKQRLGRYRDEKNVEAAASSAASEPPLSIATSNLASTISSALHSASTAVKSTLAPSDTPSDSNVPEKTVAEEFAADLAVWERQVLRATEEGAEHLKERVEEICSDQEQNQVEAVGRSLIIQLEGRETKAVKALQQAIKHAVAKLPEDHSEEDVLAALPGIDAQARAAGASVKDKALEIRQWRKALDRETTNLIETAANSTIETVDSIRELRLHEIGRKWASRDGVTHRDWAQYNELKKKTGQWRDSIAQIVLQHKAFEALRASATEIEDRAMAIAEDAAKEFGRLKQVARWKLRAGDDSDSFENRTLPPIVAKVKSQVVDAMSSASESVVDSSQGTVESVTSAVASKASSIVDAASDALDGVSDPMYSSASSLSKSIVESSILTASSMASSISAEYFGEKPSAAEDLASEVFRNVIEGSQKVLSGDASIIKATASSMSSAASKMLSRASEELNSKPSQASKEAISKASSLSDELLSAGTSSSIESLSTETSGSVASVSSAVVSASPVSAVSEAIEGLASNAPAKLPPHDAGKIGESASSVSSLSSDASSAVVSDETGAKKPKDSAREGTSRVFAGAMAQAVPEQKPIFDSPLEDEDDDEISTDGSYDSVAKISEAVEQALFGTKTESNAAGSATSIASDIWSSAYNAASSVLYGKTKSGGIPAYISEKYDEAVSAASRVVAAFSPTPTPTGYELAASVQSQIDSYTDLAYESWQSQVRQAQDVASSAQSRIQKLISGTPKPVHEQMLKSVDGAMKQALEAARTKYEVALEQRTIFHQSTQAPYESLSSVASVNLAKALKTVSAQYSSATAAVGLQPKSGSQQSLDEAKRQYYQGKGYAHDQYSSYLRSATRALQSAGMPFVTPAPTGYGEMFMATARSRYSDLSSSAASALSDAVASVSSAAEASSTSPAQSLLDAASSEYSSAVSAASKAYYAKQTPVYIDWMNKVSSRQSDIQDSASSVFQSAYTSALSVAGYRTEDNPTFDAAVESAWAAYEGALQGADSAIRSLSKYAQSAIYGTETGAMASATSKFSSLLYGSQAAWSENVQSQAAENWEAIVAAASERVYGTPSPVFASVTSQITSAAAQATSAAAEQYSAVSSLFASLITGREPDYTDKVFSQLSSAYYTGAGAAVSSASLAVSSAYAAVQSVFVAPPAIDSYVAEAQKKIDAAISVASASLYDTPTGSIESVTSVASSAASSLINAAKAAQSSAASYAQDANSKISALLYGEPEPTHIAVQASRAATDAASSVSSAAAKISASLYGDEKRKASESAAKRLEDMVEAARTRLAELRDGVATSADRVKESLVSGAGEVRDAVESVVGRVKDEL